jgi:CBS domain-containing protein
MTASPVHGRPNDDILAAVALMVRERIRHLPIVDDEQRVLGVLSDRDVRQALGDPEAAIGDEEPRLEGWPVADIMTHGPMTIGPDASVVVAARRMRESRVGALVVVDEERRLVGMLSYLDLLDRAYR